LPWLQQSKDVGEMFFSVRSIGEPTALVRSIRQVIGEVDRNLPLVELKTQVTQSRESLKEDRVFAQLLTFFALLALTLAAVGLYGVMAYSVAQRTSEIGIRMALGAQMMNVLRLVIWQGLKLVLLGLIVGAGGVFALRKIVLTQLYGVTVTDPLTFVVVGALLLVIAFLACFFPARRAAKVDPLVALRYE
jgi:putative ABC transport system permease protein